MTLSIFSQNGKKGTDKRRYDLAANWNGRVNQITTKFVTFEDKARHIYRAIGLGRRG